MRMGANELGTEKKTEQNDDDQTEDWDKCGKYNIYHIFNTFNMYILIITNG